MANLKIDQRKTLLILARQEMSRAELCDAAGITESNLSIILKRGTIREKTAGKIARVLKVDVAEILQQPGQEISHAAAIQ